ncbi:MAG: right-handed parallel beta-helix repeat-containing protein, partial [Anaerolineae bacterium]
GTAADGSTALANGANGVRLFGSTNTVGGTAAGAANIIARNTDDGVLVADGTGNVILGNSIHTNGDLGIDLNDGAVSFNGVTTNDVTDSDGGANNTQNFPALSAATISGSDLTMDGTLDSALGTDFRIEFFSNTTCTGPGNGEGRTYLDSTTVQSGAFSYTIVGAGVSEGAFITATATRLSGGSPVETSEFSGCVAASSAPVAGLFIINSRLDDADASAGDGFCATAGAVCTLRAAIQEANAQGGSDPYTLSFNISGGNHTIEPTTALPVITVPVNIDGTTEPDYSGTTPVIKLDGISAPGGTNGLVLQGGSSTVRGLAIIRWPVAGIHLDSNDNTVIRNYIGVDTDGTTASANGIGVLAEGADNIIGSTTANNRNIIAANTVGVELLGAGATGNSVIGNYIGLRADGAGTLGNITGVLIDDAPSNSVGGSSATQRNIISGNTNGIVIQNSGAAGNTVYGNYIGVNPGGTLDYGNTADGIRINNAPSNLIGNTGGSANIISGNNGDGVEILGGASGTQIIGNSIGLDSGAASRPNGAAGINISNGSNTIIQTNTIAYNGSDGVGVLSGTGNLITANSIFSNTGLGIDLGANGVLTNDSGDGDSGANNLQNYPFITLAGPLSGTTLVEGLFNSTASTNFTLDIYKSTACDATNFGEGATFMGSGSVTTDGSGDATFSFVVSSSSSIGNFITATARDASGNTSEFSLCYQIVAAAPTLTPTNTGTPTNTATVTQTGTATNTPTVTLTPTRTRTPTPTASRTPTRTNTPVRTNTPTGGGGSGGTASVASATSAFASATVTITGTLPTSTPTGSGTASGPVATSTLSLFIASNTPTATEEDGIGGGALETAIPTETPTPSGGGLGFDTPTVTPNEFEVQLTQVAETATAEANPDAGGGGFPMWIVWVGLGLFFLLLLIGGAIELIRWLNSRQG